MGIDMKLTNEEVTTRVWQKVEGFVQEGLSMARKENDHMIPENRTCYLRGKIAAYNEILQTGEQDDS